jgi:hypothetical protein
MRLRLIAVVFALALVIVTAGCNGFATNPEVTDADATPETRTAETTAPAPTLTQTGAPTEYVLFTERVETAPEGATVVTLTSSRLDGDRVLKRIVRTAASEGGDTRNLHERIHERLSEQLRDLPAYDGPRGAAYYLQHRGQIVRLSIGVEE